MQIGNRRTTPRGITLLEVMVALALGSLLLVALSGVLSGMNRLRNRLAAVRSDEWVYALDRVIWNDLAQARQVGLDQGVLTLLVPNTDQRLGNPALRDASIPYVPVSYMVETQPNGSRALVRRSLEQRVLVWDVTQASFERIDDQGVDQPLPQSLGPAPRGFHYRIWLAGDSQPIDRRITVR
jgi:prepilin-type N-terminal cleavage/methylation domain-containing protein